MAINRYFMVNIATVLRLARNPTDNHGRVYTGWAEIRRTKSLKSKCPVVFELKDVNHGSHWNFFIRISS